MFCCNFLKNVQYAISVKYSNAWSCCMKYQREEQYFNSDFQNGESEMVSLSSEWIRCLVKWWFRKNCDHLLWKGLSVCIKCEIVNSAKCSTVLSPDIQISTECECTAHPMWVASRCLCCLPILILQSFHLSLNSWLVMPMLSGGWILELNIMFLFICLSNLKE